MRYCENSSKISSEYRESFGHIMDIVQIEVSARNLEYMDIHHLHEPGDKRLVFDILTTDLNSGKKCLVHVDYTSTLPTVEQFVDCIYGSGSASDLKIIIFNDEYWNYSDFYEESAFYFVKRLIIKCNAVDIPFELIYYSPSSRTDQWGHWLSLEKREKFNTHPQSGPLPTKRDIQGMAFWVHHEDDYELHQLHCDRSSGICISGDLCVFVKWTDEGLFNVISDCHQSEFIPWLWNNRIEYLERTYPGLKLSTYRDGKHSYICVHANKTPFHELQKMRHSERERLVGQYFYTARKWDLEAMVRNAWKQYEKEIDQTKDNLPR